MKSIALSFFLVVLHIGCGSKKVEPIQYSPASPPEGMVFIPGGVFMMGLDGFAGNFYKQTSPKHPVSISSFYMSKHTVVISEIYDLIYGNGNYNVSERTKKPRETSYHGAVLNCNRMSERDGLEKVYEIEEDKNGNITSIITHFDRIGYRLPTEAEWEYAARAGTTTMYYWGDTFEDYVDYELPPSSSREPQVAGQLKPNPFGLYDMLSNIPELTNDLYDPDFYTPNSVYNPRNVDPRGEVKDPRVSSNQKLVTFRGGAFRGANVVGPEFNPGFRDGVGMRSPGMKVGFRVVLPTNDPPPPIPDSLLQKYPLKEK